jgi:hypothetical protein
LALLKLSALPEQKLNDDQHEEGKQKVTEQLHNEVWVPVVFFVFFEALIDHIVDRGGAQGGVDEKLEAD